MTPDEAKLEATAPYTQATNKNHPTKVGWFDEGTEYIRKALLGLIEKETLKQVGLTGRKMGTS